MYEHNLRNSFNFKLMAHLYHLWRTSAIIMILSVTAQGQIFKDPEEVIKRKSVNRAENRANRTVDRGLDKVEEGIEGLFKKKDKEKDKNPKNQQNATAVENSSTPVANSEDAATPGKNDNKSGETFKTYSKFDFVPGEKVIAVEDFMQDAVGDFPAKWNTNGTGEIVTIGKSNAHWLKMGSESVVYPEFINNLPDNFTFEFDLACNNDFNFYSTWFLINFSPASQNDFSLMNEWKCYGNRQNGVKVGLHPQSAGGQSGRKGYWLYQGGQEVLKNEADIKSFHHRTANNVHVAMWRQKSRLRVYVNEEKILDIPKAFSDNIKYSKILFTTCSYNKDQDAYYIGNLRLAVGAADTRNKIITEGRLVTNGITFDVNSSNIKPNSYGILKEIADALKENPNVNIKIIGHTDSDGDAQKNMELSKSRAESVKRALVSEFGIDEKRMQTEGKGATQPLQPNTTPEGKANNRRVEFVKI